MGHTGMSQFHTGLSRFLTAVAIENYDVSTNSLEFSSLRLDWAGPDRLVWSGLNQTVRSGLDQTVWSGPWWSVQEMLAHLKITLSTKAEKFDHYKTTLQPLKIFAVLHVFPVPIISHVMISFGGCLEECLPCFILKKQVSSGNHYQFYRFWQQCGTDSGPARSSAEVP